MALLQLPDDLVEKIVGAAVGKTVHVPRIAAVCRMFQMICRSGVVWHHLCCDRFQLLELQSSLLSPGSWEALYRAHDRLIRKASQPKPVHMLFDGRRRLLGRRPLQSQLPEYAFQVELWYAEQCLSKWTGTFPTYSAMGSYHEVEHGGVPAPREVLDCCSCLLWTFESSPWSQQPELDLPCDIMDPPEQWDKVELHVYVSHKGRTQKLFVTTLIESWTFEMQTLLEMPPRRSRSLTSSAKDSIEFSPCLLIGPPHPRLKHSGLRYADGDVLEEGVAWACETRMAFNVMYYHDCAVTELKSVGSGKVRAATEAEVLAALELRFSCEADTA